MTSKTAARTASVLANHVISESLPEAKAKFRDAKPHELLAGNRLAISLTEEVVKSHCAGRPI
jgi:hypothetical protein